MPRVPSYVRPLLHEGEKVRYDKETNQWIACRFSSKRVPGKTSPQRVSIDIAVISNMGRKELKPDPTPSLTIVECQCLEYGASRLLKEKLPSQWVRLMGSHCESIFLDFIKKIFPDSYLLHDVEYSLPQGVNVSLRQENLWEYYHEIGITLERIKPLAAIHLLRYPDRCVVTAPSAEQERLLAQLNVSLI